MKIKIQANVDVDVVQKAEQYLHMMGISRTMAINMLYHQIANTGEFPFVPQLGNVMIEDEESEDDIDD